MLRIASVPVPYSDEGVTPNTNVPGCVGVPLSTPEFDIVTPGGSVPEVLVIVMVPDPLAVTGPPEYAVFIVPDASDVVVMAGAADSEPIVIVID